MDQMSEEQRRADGDNDVSTKGRFIPDLIAAQAVSRPVAVALTMGEQRVSYADLNRQANQLAHRLLALGIKPGTLVGLCAERSLRAVIGMLGILKAGGAYVPLDPTYPTERLAFMLRDASLAFLVTQSQMLPLLPVQEKVSVILLDSDEAVLDEHERVDPEIDMHDQNLAYVLYTSGSTGQPKGVEITHANVLHLIDWHQKAFAIRASDHATQVSSLAFDAAGWELWPYLTLGAQVSLVDEQTRRSPLLLRDWLLEKRITVTFLPTPLAEEMMALEWPSSIPLRLLLTGADRLRRYPPGDLPFAVVNNYGPTETTVVATSGRVLPTDDATILPSIGYPINNVQIYILDEQLQPVPQGTTGELYIGGAGLAKGYLNRPALTVERFIRHPFRADPDARLYKTGDLCYVLADGQIAFVGRNDHQVKVRGMRIELGEIETVLNRDPLVARAIVLDKEGPAEIRQLVAYIQLHDLALAEDTSAQIEYLRQMLAQQLPEYMLPLEFQLVNEFPLTHNGKIDYVTLAASVASIEVHSYDPALNSIPVQSERSIEEGVAEIIKSVLGQEQIAPDDNFFMLGGHSLLGALVIARVAETFEVDLSLRTVFDAPTISLLAGEIEARIIEKIEAMSEDEVLQILTSGQNS